MPPEIIWMKRQKEFNELQLATGWMGYNNLPT